MADKDDAPATETPNRAAALASFSAPADEATAPVSVPVVVKERRKAKKLQVDCRRVFDATGQLERIHMRPRPGNEITEVIIVAPFHRTANKVGVITEPRRGRRRKSQPEQE
jgi:hypothetical protein